jgi:hypothetical protein
MRLKKCTCGYTVSIIPEEDSYTIHCNSCGLERNSRRKDQVISLWNNLIEKKKERRKICLDAVKYCKKSLEKYADDQLSAEYTRLIDQLETYLRYS